ncbi:MAG: hypothetical protein ACKO23_14930 [Gemmataceae bacterium]
MIYPGGWKEFSRRKTPTLRGLRPRRLTKIAANQLGMINREKGDNFYSISIFAHDVPGKKNARQPETTPGSSTTGLNPGNCRPWQ